MRTDPTHLPALDGLRGLAILLVIVYHTVLNYPFEAGEDSIVYQLGSIGWAGVDLFFVLSGFLITGILLDSKGASNFFRAFYGRRILRIFPLYYATLSVLFLAPYFGAPTTPEIDFIRNHQLFLWTYTTNWGFVAAHGARFFNADWLAVIHFWTLAVEEQFYLLWPLVIFLTNRRMLGWLCLALFIGALACRWAMDLLELPTNAAYTLTPSRLDGFAVGAAIALVIRLPGDNALRQAMHKIAPQVSLIIATIMIYIFATHKGLRFGDRVMHTNGFSLLAFGFGGLLVICLPFHAPSIVRMLFLAAPMRFLGKYSYGLYVLHYLMLPHLPPSPYVGLTVWEVVNVVIYFLVCLMLFIAAAWLSWHLLEQPFLSLKRYWHYGAKQSYPEIQAQGGGERVGDIGLTERTVGPIATARRHSEPD